MINYSWKPKFDLSGQLLKYYELICISKQQLFLLTNTSLFLNDVWYVENWSDKRIQGLKCDLFRYYKLFFKVLILKGIRN